MKTIYLIKDLAIKTGLSIYTIKYYLRVGLVREIGRSPDTNFRYFDETTVKKLLSIRELRKKNRSINEIKKGLPGH
ncbi:MAG: MerR family transcriptional regulator [Candidatus Omnitrophica bacterium]|nr:MerR family transcriptional regulator [Candidatus Omnitrophota bacterium]